MQGKIRSRTKIIIFVSILFSLWIIFCLYIQFANADQLTLFNQKEISKQEAIKLLPESAVKEKIRIIIADSVELLGNVIMIKVGDITHVVSVEKIEFKGRGKSTKDKEYEMYEKTDAEVAVIKEEEENYCGAALFYENAGNKEKAKEMYLMEIETVLNDPDLDYTKESKYDNAGYFLIKIGEFIKAEKLYMELMEDAKKEQRWQDAAMWNREANECKEAQKLKDGK